MKIKAAEIARQLGISKATVSLALNNRPGVSEETKKKIMQYIDRVENGIVVEEDKNIIKVLYYTKKMEVFYHSEVDLWSCVLASFSQEAKKDGYTLSIDYIGDSNESVEQAIIDCNKENIAGVILFGTEMDKAEFEVFKQIEKPLVVYDNDFEDINYSYVMIDNFRGIEKILSYLKEKGYQDITYFANKGKLYNFDVRREAFDYFTNRYHQKGEIIFSGKDVDSSYEFIKDYLLTHQECKTLVCENFEVSIGAIKAIKELGLEIGKDLVVVGIDEIPDYFCYGYQLTCLKVAHGQRAYMAIVLLKQEIAHQNVDKFRVYSSCELVIGNTA